MATNHQSVNIGENWRHAASRPLTPKQVSRVQGSGHFPLNPVQW